MVWCEGKWSATAMALGKTIRIVEQGIDRPGRAIAEVFLPDGRELRHELVRTGCAWWYREYASGDEVLDRLEREARDTGLGLWSNPDAIPPYVWRNED